ncbi:SAND domain-containing protein [Caenorhabditis elegans]|uniref:SAND domain-containing protein n=1 Tax=Caenorhabditis elegans TaxID=6239 RepID=Q18624_CAEEL|nr:SAND domain-containing protein [Caenorhabditis elegans]CAA88849.2 SAND domain-containing protein [Caenorhabditis elegans]|eukprot:NP_497762.2 GMEB (Glucocorticoid Modulatory Element Binding protein) transcriptional regulator homolog [Caenorhabditis elegans]
MCDDDDFEFSTQPEFGSTSEMKNEEMLVPSDPNFEIDGRRVQENMYDQASELSYTYLDTPSEHIWTPIVPLNATTVPVTCGYVKGIMHLKLFRCPGIRQACIEYESQYLTPKQFTELGGKGRQKDWKACIRVENVSLRTLLENKTIDFYNHKSICHGQCQSRNYMNSTGRAPVNKRHLEDVLASGDDASEPTEQSSGQISEEPIKKRGRGRPAGKKNKAKLEINFVESEDQLVFEEFFQPAFSTRSPAPERPVCSPAQDIYSCLQNDPMSFWSQIKRSGFISQFCDDIIAGAINLKQSAMTQSLNQNSAFVLTRATFALGIQKPIVNRVQSIERNVNEQKKQNEMMEDQGKYQEDAQTEADDLDNQPRCSYLLEDL